jgi:putative sigma-54 modulation protein
MEMNVDITGRQVEITAAIREFTLEKLRKLERLLEGPLEVHVVLGISKHRHVAEIQVKSRTATLSGMEETGDLFASIAEAAEKLERQALKHKEKVTDRKRREGTRAPDAVAAMQAEATAPVAEPVIDDQATRVIRSERYRLKPLSLEDALMELESTGHEILVFRDAGSTRINVLYRRGDGHFGLIEPEFG